MNFRWIPVMLLMVSCASLPASTGPFGEWDQRAFRQALERGGVTLVDLRTPAEAATGQLPGCRTVDYWSPDFERYLRDGDKSVPHLVYCAHGVRGRQAAERMRAAGFLEVHNLVGGIAAWKETP